MRGVSSAAGTDSEDPLARALAPPPNETLEEQERRLKREAEAQRVSDQIDEVLRQEKTALKKKKVMKMLLLGQAESGKSTTLKTMQITYAPKAWAAERASWRAVTQLNLIRSINAVLDALAIELDSSPKSKSPTPYSNDRSSSEENAPMAPGGGPDADQSSFTTITIPADRKSALMKLKLRLAPLRQVEVDLKTRLGAGTDEILQGSAEGMMVTPFDDAAYVSQPRRHKTPNPKEIVVRSHKAWKEKERAWKLGGLSRLTSGGSSFDERERDSATEILAECKDDMVALWTDQLVREVVRRRKVIMGLGDSAEYFLDRISHIATRDYEPSDDDVLRARIRTLGVQEHTVVFEQGQERDLWKEWAIFDVGGARSSRAAWLPYFTDVQTVVFLAPISAFDERLTEDKRVNRLEDSFILWQSIVKSPLLVKAILILFMNKTDLLEKKLLSGVQIKNYMTSYGNRKNDADTFTAYLKQKFKELHANLSPERRPFYAYPTSVIDADATAVTLASIRDGILQAHLKSATFVS